MWRCCSYGSRSRHAGEKRQGRHAEILQIRSCGRSRYLIAMFLCTLGVDMAETKAHHLPESILLLGSALLVSAIATNVGNKLYTLTNFSDKKRPDRSCSSPSSPLIAAVTPLGKVAGSGEVSNLLLYAVIGLLASRASLLELGEAFPPGSPPASLSSASTRC